MKIYLLTAAAKLNARGPLGAKNTSYTAVFAANDDESAKTAAYKELLKASRERGFVVGSASLRQIAVGAIVPGVPVVLTGPEEWSVDGAAE